MTEIYRQGDVLIRRVESIPEGTTKEDRDQDGRIVLALGEVTGHAHVVHGLNATMFRDQALARRFLKVDEPEALTHEEHSTIVLPKGLYEVVIQQEYRPGAVPRPVLD